jgi:thiamine-monophosphate kinase
MPVGEFELIERHFVRPSKRAALGPGDDCALLQVAPGQQLAVSSDMLVEGRHFLSTVAPERLGHKALAVNLSDLAACGAEPLAFTLALALPRADEAFVAPLARGLFALAEQYGIELVGGDTTAGPLNLCITVMGQVPVGQALLRSGARPGDELWVSGALGDARLALEVFRGSVDLPGLALRGLASSSIDISDGLLGDLGHLLRRSGVGARLQLPDLPRSATLAAQAQALQHECLLRGGDDYELLFTAPPARRAAVLAAGSRAAVTVTCIGRIEAGAGLVVVDEHGQAQTMAARGFDHFT